MRAKAQPVADHEAKYDEIVSLALSKGRKVLDAEGNLRNHRNFLNPEVFDTQGRLRDRHFYLHHRIVEQKGAKKKKKIVLIYLSRRDDCYDHDLKLSLLL